MGSPLFKDTLLVGMFLSRARKVRNRYIFINIFEHKKWIENQIKNNNEDSQQNLNP